MSITNKMKINGENMKEATIMEKILKTLTRKFNYVVVSIKESNDIHKLTIDELQSSLVVHEKSTRERFRGKQHGKPISKKKPMKR
ncbi:hypothetical protein CR513_53736, partial [Mucuna pruriens]